MKFTFIEKKGLLKISNSLKIKDINVRKIKVSGLCRFWMLCFIAYKTKKRVVA